MAGNMLMKITHFLTWIFKRTERNFPALSVFRQNDGFSLVEIGIFLLVACSVAGFALIQMQGIMPGMHANQAMYQTVAQLRHGREVAIAQRRSVQLDFLGQDQIRLVQNGLPDGQSVLSTVLLSNQCSFMKFDGLEDTPDHFGNTRSVDFGGAASQTFLTDGTLVDEAGNPVNGTVFLGLPDHPEVARAVTILGATGRVRSYRWDGSRWIQ
jgi:Tfp pilus assembly protein FimT